MENFVVGPGELYKRTSEGKYVSISVSYFIEMASKFFFLLLLLVPALLSFKLRKFDETPLSEDDYLLIRNCSQLKKVPCPTPIRPENVMDFVETDRTNMLRFMLTMRSCETKNSEEDLFFTLDDLLNNYKIILVSAFDMYRKYKNCPSTCRMFVLYTPPINNIADHVLTNLSSDIYLQCGHRFSNCSIISWYCPKWTRAKYGPNILAMIDEMLPPRNVVVQGPEKVPSLVLVLYIGFGVIFFFVSVVFLKKV